MLWYSQKHLPDSHCFPVLQPNEQLPLNLLYASLMHFKLHGSLQFSPKDWTHSESYLISCDCTQRKSQTKYLF